MSTDPTAAHQPSEGTGAASTAPLPVTAAAASHDPRPQQSEADWSAASDWAESATFTPGDFIPAESDPLGPHAGADLLRRAGVGRPPLDPATPAGQSSHSRPVRLGQDLDQQLQDYLAELARQGSPSNASEVIRTALRDHLHRQSTHQHTA